MSHDSSLNAAFSSNPTLWKVMQEAAKEAGYGETLEFDVRFNVDILLQGAQHADTEVGGPASIACSLGESDANRV